MAKRVPDHQQFRGSPRPSPHRGFQVDAQDLAPAVVGEGGDRPVAEAPAAHPDGVNDPVQSPECRCRVLDGVFSTAGLGDVPAGPVDAERLMALVVDELLAGGADPAAGAGDENPHALSHLTRRDLANRRACSS